jgi:hypothetical protein
MASTVGFYTVKMAAIFIMAIIYFIVGSIMSIGLDNIMPEKKELEETPTYLIFLKICGIFGIIAVLYYFLRIQIKNMPFFLDGLYGFKYNMLKEASGGIIVAYIMYIYQDRLGDMLKELRKRLTKY